MPLNYEIKPEFNIKITRSSGAASTATTVVLAAILVAALLAAQLLIMSRSGRQDAYDNAVQLLSKVSRDGLVKYLGPKPITRFYLLEADGKPVGYMALHLYSKTLPDQTVRVYGRDIFQDMTTQIRSQSSFVIENDLAQFQYTHEYINNLTGERLHSARMNYDSPLLQLSFPEIIGPKTTEPVEITKKNFILPSLLDFFSSLAAREEYRHGALFYFLDISRLPPQSVLPQECWVTNADDLPEPLKELSPHARGVHVKWIYDRRQQIIFYDRDNQLLWQKDMLDGEESTCRAVASEDIVKIYPQAARALSEWRNIGNAKNLEIL